MRTLRMLLTVAVLAGMAATCVAAAPEMANLVPANAKALVETVDAAGLRQMLLDSKFWAALQETEAVRDWQASQRYAETQERVERLLANLEMSEQEALKAYLGGRSAVVLLDSGQEKPYGVALTEATNAMAERLAKASGGREVSRYRDVAIWEVRKEDRVDRLAFAGGVLMVSGSWANELEQVIDVIVGGGAALGTEGHFQSAAAGLPAGWRARAYAAAAGPHKSPGAVAMYPKSEGRVHFEWRMVGPTDDLALNQPAKLTAPACLPDTAVAAVATALHPEAIWARVKAEAEKKPNGEDNIRKAEMFVRGWFPGYTMPAILGAFGPEAAIALVKGDAGSAPGLLVMAKLTGTGGPVARSFKSGLAAKAMILGALAQNNEKAPKLNVREEAYGNAELLVIEASNGALEKFLGPWAKDIGLTVAVTNDWLIVGTTPAGVKKAIDTAAGNGTSLAAAMTSAGEKVPTEPATRWGVVQPASGADIVLTWAERIAGAERVDEAKKVVNLAELLKLVNRMLWQRTDEPKMIRGTTDIQAIE